MNEPNRINTEGSGERGDAGLERWMNMLLLEDYEEVSYSRDGKGKVEESRTCPGEDMADI